VAHPGWGAVLGSGGSLIRAAIHRRMTVSDRFYRCMRCIARMRTSLLHEFGVAEVSE
jgi:hypothetical protein